MFWPGMASDIKPVADSCTTTKEMKPQTTQEPLNKHYDGDGAWEKVGLDIFEIAAFCLILVRQSTSLKCSKIKAGSEPLW